MVTLIQMQLLRKPSTLLVFLFLVVAVHCEIPEHIRLIDDTSNDFVVSARGNQSVQPRAISEQGARILGSGPVEVLRSQTGQDFRSPSAAEPFHLSGQDCLLLWSIQRI
jgi:hypothetical protein